MSAFWVKRTLMLRSFSPSDPKDDSVPRRDDYRSRHDAYCLGMLAAFTSSRLAATSSLKNWPNSATVIGSFSTPNLRQPLLHRRQCQRLYDLVVQLVDDGARRFRRQVGSGIEWIDRIGLEAGFE